MIRLLLSAGAKFNVKDEDNGMTPLSWICLHGHLELAKELLARRASINHRSERGATPLDFARNFGRHELASFLRGRGAEEGSGLMPSRIEQRAWGADSMWYEDESSYFSSDTSLSSPDSENDASGYDEENIDGES